MKIQHLSVIFIIIMIPIILVFSYYMKLEKEALEVRKQYDQKLTMSIKEAVRAYEVNTAEFNYYDEREDEENTGRTVNQREAIYASINAFTTSLANNFGISRSK